MVNRYAHHSADHLAESLERLGAKGLQIGHYKVVKIG
jgi:hypothetical protein